MSTSIIVKGKDGGMFCTIIDDKDWIPMEKRDIGKSVQPSELIEVKAGWRLLFCKGMVG